MCQSMGGVHSLEVGLGCLSVGFRLGFFFFFNAAWLGPVTWCERLKRSNAKE